MYSVITFFRRYDVVTTVSLTLAEVCEDRGVSVFRKEVYVHPCTETEVLYRPYGP